MNAWFCRDSGGSADSVRASGERVCGGPARSAMWYLAALGTAACMTVACSTAGSTWMAQPLPGDQEPYVGEEDAAPELYSVSGVNGVGLANAPERASRAQRIGTPQLAHTSHTAPLAPVSRRTIVVGAEPQPKKLAGRILGKFRNTYYDFPAEADFDGDPVSLMNASCEPIRRVARGFYEAVCVQGSGTLVSGTTVSFAKRDCECAAICPRTDQKICFDALDPKEYPWGRGATGKAITPLLTVAVDSGVIPLGTAVYIPELDGAPRDLAGTTKHDGCFIAQDRGVRVKGKHIDVFTGHESMTKLWNTLFPSNDGVTVVLESPRCERVGDITPMYER